MKRKLLNGLGWGASIAILVGMFVGLDGYVRPSLDGGWGPERRRYFGSTLERAHELQDAGRYRVQPNEGWLLRGGWEEDLSDGKALAVHRRARLVLPVLRAEPLEIRLQVMPLPPKGQEEPIVTELEYGLNGVHLGRFVVPPDGGVLRFGVAPPGLYRGDNILYLYRLTRRSDPEPWLALSWMNARVAGDGS